MLWHIPCYEHFKHMIILRNSLTFAITCLLYISCFSQTPSLVDYDAYEKIVSEVKEHRAERLIDLDKFIEMSKMEDVVILDTRSKAMYVVCFKEVLLRCSNAFYDGDQCFSFLFLLLLLNFVFTFLFVVVVVSSSSGFSSSSFFSSPSSMPQDWAFWEVALLINSMDSMLFFTLV